MKTMRNIVIFIVVLFNVLACDSSQVGEEVRSPREQLNETGSNTNNKHSGGGLSSLEFSEAAEQTKWTNSYDLSEVVTGYARIDSPSNNAYIVSPNINISVSVDQFITLQSGPAIPSGPVIPTGPVNPYGFYREVYELSLNIIENCPSSRQIVVPESFKTIIADLATSTTTQHLSYSETYTIPRPFLCSTYTARLEGRRGTIYTSLPTVYGNPVIYQSVNYNHLLPGSEFTPVINGAGSLRLHQSERYTVSSTNGINYASWAMRVRQNGTYQQWSQEYPGLYTYASVNSCAISEFQLRATVVNSINQTGTAYKTVYISNPC